MSFKNIFRIICNILYGYFHFNGLLTEEVVKNGNKIRLVVKYLYYCLFNNHSVTIDETCVKSKTVVHKFSRFKVII